MATRERSSVNSPAIAGHSMPYSRGNTHLPLSFATYRKQLVTRSTPSRYLESPTCPLPSVQNSVIRSTPKRVRGQTGVCLVVVGVRLRFIEYELVTCRSSIVIYHGRISLPFNPSRLWPAGPDPDPPVHQIITWRVMNPRSNVAKYIGPMTVWRQVAAFFCIIDHHQCRHIR